jgi:hypothetical protein
LIHPRYLPFTSEELRSHFLGDAHRQIRRFIRSAERYALLETVDPRLPALPLDQAKTPCQIERDERFWTTTALKRLVDAPNAKDAIQRLLRQVFDARPLLSGFASWDECLTGELRLILEAVLPAPGGYVTWLRGNLARRHFIPYVLRAAKAIGCQRLEGPTHVDAIILNVSNGFALCIEAKVLSDISGVVSFDIFRNQLVRNLDIMLEQHQMMPYPLSMRRPESSLMVLLTPRCFKEQPHSRLYGWLVKEYTNSPEALQRDLPHRAKLNALELSRRLGWLTFEDICEVVPGACPWLSPGAA